MADDAVVDLGPIFLHRGKELLKLLDRLLLAYVSSGRRQVHCCLLVAGLRTIHVRHNTLLQDRDGVQRTNTGLNGRKEVVESLVAHEDNILRSGCAGVVVFRRGQRKQMYRCREDCLAQPGRAYGMP